MGSIGSEASIATKSMKMIFMIGDTSNATVINELEVEMEEFGGTYICMYVHNFSLFFKK